MENNFRGSDGPFGPDPVDEVAECGPKAAKKMVDGLIVKIKHEASILVDWHGFEPDETKEKTEAIKNISQGLNSLDRLSELLGASID